jgi:hypothetical protein
MQIELGEENLQAANISVTKLNGRTKNYYINLHAMLDSKSHQVRLVLRIQKTTFLPC